MKAFPGYHRVAEAWWASGLSLWAECRFWTAALCGALQAGSGRSVQRGDTHMGSPSFVWGREKA